MGVGHNHISSICTKNIFQHPETWESIAAKPSAQWCPSVSVPSHRARKANRTDKNRIKTNHPPFRIVVVSADQI